MKNLLILATHFIDKNVISEFLKMQNTPNVDAVLMIDNTKLKIDFNSRVEDRICFGTKVKCCFLDSDLDNELQLPYFSQNNEPHFATTALHNGDYRFYYIRKFLPDYDFYWIIEYDVFCNAENYSGFLEKFKDNRADLLIQAFEEGRRNTSDVLRDIDWAYDESKIIYVGIFAVVRLSARAIDFLYNRRLEHKEIFSNSTEQNKQWIFCEVFVPTELMHGGFICENLNEERVRFLPQIYLNDERIFLYPDNHLYHPVKSVSAEISKLKKQYADLFFCFRKNFFMQLDEKLSSIPTIKNLPIQFDEKFNFMIIDLTGKTGSGLRCETWFLTDKLYNAAFKLYVGVIFEGEYLKYFKNIEQYLDFSKMHSMQILGNSNCKMLAYGTYNFDNISQIVNVTEILIEMTFTALQEKIE